MTTTPGFLSGTLGSAQDLFTITYPVIDTHQTSIANVSKASTAIVSLGSATTSSVQLVQLAQSQVQVHIQQLLVV